jgi:NitT/TauT family transport system permease protein
VRRFAVTVLPTLALLALLEGLKRAGALPDFIPGPGQVLAAAWAHPALLWDNLLPTAATAAEGFVIAAVATLAAAGVGTAVRSLWGAVYGLGVVMHAIPVIATAPLLALWLGTGGVMHVVIVALAAQFPLLVGAMQGLAATDARQMEMLHCLSASRWQVFRYLQLPSALPFLFAGFKVATPLAVLGAVTAEWAGADRGIGAVMLNALFSYDTVTVWLAVLTCCAFAGLAYAAWSLIERTALRWNRPAELPT